LPDFNQKIEHLESEIGSLQNGPSRTLLANKMDMVKEIVKAMRTQMVFVEATNAMAESQNRLVSVNKMETANTTTILTDFKDQFIVMDEG